MNIATVASGGWQPEEMVKAVCWRTESACATLRDPDTYGVRESAALVGFAGDWSGPTTRQGR